MREPDMFKFDVRVRERMLRSGRITAEDVNRVLEALPDLENSVESVALNQPAFDATVMAASAARQLFPPAISSDDGDGEVLDSGDST